MFRYVMLCEVMLFYGLIATLIFTLNGVFDIASELLWTEHLALKAFIRHEQHKLLIQNPKVIINVHYVSNTIQSDRLKKGELVWWFFSR